MTHLNRVQEESWLDFHCRKGSEVLLCNEQELEMQKNVFPVSRDNELGDDVRLQYAMNSLINSLLFLSTISLRHQ